jgi:hypothetical protein
MGLSVGVGVGAATGGRAMIVGVGVGAGLWRPPAIEITSPQIMLATMIRLSIQSMMLRLECCERLMCCLRWTRR